MKILFYFGHPAQYLFLRQSIQILREKSISCDIVIKSKDILEKLLIENGEIYFNILPEGRKSGNLGMLYGLLKRDIRLLNFIRGKSYDLFIGTDSSLAHIGFFKRIPVITVVEDDIDIIPKLAKLTYPFTSVILTPRECRTGKFEFKTIRYDGYMKLAYLHPSRFEKKAAIFKQPYFIIRVSALDAHHDKGVSGLTTILVKKLIQFLQTRGEVYISAESAMDEYFYPFLLKINPSELHQVLANAEILISDSQSMSMEAAMLGVPSIRFSDFAGKISVLEELEHKYNLTFGIPTHLPDKLFCKIEELLNMLDLQNEFKLRRLKMLNDKVDVTAFLNWFIQNYPMSVRIMQEKPEYQDIFR